MKVRLIPIYHYSRYIGSLSPVQFCIHNLLPHPSSTTKLSTVSTLNRWKIGRSLTSIRTGHLVSLYSEPTPRNTLCGDSVRIFADTKLHHRDLRRARSKHNNLVPKTFGYQQLGQGGVRVAEQAPVVPGLVVELVQELVRKLLRSLRLQLVLQRAQVGQDVLVEEGD